MNGNEEPQVSAEKSSDDKTRLSVEEQRKLSRARGAARAVGLFLPLVLTVFGTLLLILWVPRVPDPAAVHWDLVGEPNGFGSPWTNVIAAGATSLFVTALYLLQSVQNLQKSRLVIWSATNRAFPSIILSTVTLVQLGVILLVAPQLDAPNAQDVPAVPWALSTAAGTGIAVGLASYFLQPRVRIERPQNSDSKPMVLEDSERGFWFGEVRPFSVFIGVMIGTFAFVAGTTVLLYVNEVPFWWVMAVLLVVFAAVFACSCWFRVRIDATGLEARSIVGWPTFRVPATDIDRVAAVDIDPFGEFGGWGLRWAPGKFGIVMRTGEGIAVTRKSGRDFAITVDDAETGAALLAAAAEAALTRTQKEEKP